MTDVDVQHTPPAGVPAEVTAAELTARLRGLCRSFPPPHRTPVENTVECFRSFGADWLTALNKCCAAVAEQMNDTTRLEAVRAVIESWYDARLFPWKPTLEIVQRDWPTWGLPWYRAAHAAWSAKNYRVACSDLEVASELMPVGEPLLVAKVDDVRRLIDEIPPPYLDPRARRALLRRCAAMLLHHKASVINYAIAAGLAYEDRDDAVLRLLTNEFLVTHGHDPAVWEIEKRADDLIFAGRMCLLQNVAASESPRGHDFDRWNRAAIDFLEQGLKRGDSSADRNLRSRARTWIAEATSRLLRYGAPSVSDGEYAVLLDEALDTVTAIHDAGDVVNATRLLAMLAAGRARRAFARSAPASVVDALVAETDELYKRHAALSPPFRHSKILEWRSDFLFELGRREQALEILGDAQISDIARARAAGAAGRNAEAVRYLLTIHERGNPDWQLGFAMLLALNVERLGEKDAELRAAAVVTLRQSATWFVYGCNRALARDDVTRARRYVDLVMGYGERATALRLLLRVLDAELVEGVTSPAAAFAAIDAVLPRQEWPRHPNVLRIILRAPGDAAAPAFDETEIWSLLSLSPAADREANTGLALRWLAARPSLTTWPRRVADAARPFPRATGGALFSLWQGRRDEALPALLELLRIAAASPELHAWAGNAFAQLPGDVFRREAVSDFIAGSQSMPENAARFLAKVYASGLARHDIAQSLDSRATRRIDPPGVAATLIAAIVPQAARLQAWTAWLGANHRYVEHLVVERMRRDVRELETMLLDNADAPLLADDWYDALSRFLARQRRGPLEVSAGAKPLVRFFESESSFYEPEQSDPHYWDVLSWKIDDHVAGLGGGLLATDMAEIWATCLDFVVQAVRSRVVEVTHAQLHSFKNRIDRLRRKTSEVPSPMQRELRRVLHATETFLHGHRWSVHDHTDVTEMLESACYRRPITPTSRATVRRRPRVYVMRPPRPVAISCDRDLVVEAIYALVHNAYRATAHLEETGWVWVTAAAEGDALVVTITDNGTGAPAEVLAAMNDPSCDWARGVGFGVRLAHRVAQLHSGSVHFIPAPRGSGLQTRFSIPIA